MSQIFWDQYLDLDDINREIIQISSSTDERDELSQIVDGIIHHRLMSCILGNLEEADHEEFLLMFAKAPHDQNLTEFLKDRIKSDFVQLIKLEVEKIRQEILSFLHLS
ncbi:hypothetical protein KW795_01045 [Candidatus Microgenomates bacterium]|nr:hypothetical protein [Candidatus Microgenomates bacterium]